MDGFDVQSMGYIASASFQGWGIQNSVLGPVFSAGLFGIMIGSLLFSVMADRFVHKWLKLWVEGVVEATPFDSRQRGRLGSR